MRTVMRTILVSLVVASSAPAVAAQGAAAQPARSFTMPDSAQMSAVMAASMRRLRPAQFVLDHRAELGLTLEQVPFLESLVLAQVDSARVRTQRRAGQFREQAKSSVAARSAGALSWTGAIDEEAIRTAARQQAELSAEMQVETARDRRAVGAVLTVSQISILSQLESNDLLSGFRPNGVAARQLQPGNIYFEFQVDKHAVLLPGGGEAKYPEKFLDTKIEGQVLAQFVVDSTGRIEDGSFKVLKSSHELFTQAVRDALPPLRFKPAEIGGSKVRQLVQMPFIFDPAKVK